jgi:hypothetical protein
MKKEKLQKAIKDIVDKMFELSGHDIRYADVSGRKDDWYDQYTMTQEQNDEWFRWGIDYLYNNRIAPSKRMAKREMSWLNLGYGLRVSDTDK